MIWATAEGNTDGYGKEVFDQLNGGNSDVKKGGFFEVLILLKTC